MPTVAGASASTLDPTRDLLIPLHVAFIEALDKKRDSLAYHLTTHLRMNGVYWGLTALEILGRPQVLDRQALIDFVLSCWDDEAGGFGSFPGHDAHVHSTLSAIQILAIKEALDELDSRGMRTRIVKCEFWTPLLATRAECLTIDTDRLLLSHLLVDSRLGTATCQRRDTGR